MLKLRPIEVSQMMAGIGVHPFWIKILKKYVLELEDIASQPVYAADSNPDPCEHFIDPNFCGAKNGFR